MEENKNTILSINPGETLTISDQSASFRVREIQFTPQEDITAFELALCLQYHGRYLAPFESIDPRVERHFKIIDQK